MSISPVGTLVGPNYESGTTASLAVSPVNIGDVLIVGIFTYSASEATAVSGGGVTTWKRIGYTGAPYQGGMDVWMGVVTATGASTISATLTSSASSNMVMQEFSSSAGNVWALDGSATISANTYNASPWSLATQVPAGSNELAFNIAISSGTNFSSGGTSGYTYETFAPLIGDYGIVAFDPSVSASTTAQVDVGTNYEAASYISFLLTVSYPTTTGAAAPAAAASVSAAGKVIVNGIASPAAAASISAAGIETYLGVASPASVTSVSAAGVDTQFGIASPTSVASVSAVGIDTRFGIASPAAATSVSAAGGVVVVGVANPAATASVSVVGVAWPKWPQQSIGVYAGYDAHTAVAAIAAELGYQPIISDYIDATSPAETGNPYGTAYQWLQNGPAGAHYVFTVPIQWSGQSSGAGAPLAAYSIANVLAGDYDSDFNAVLAQIASLDSKAIIRLGHEMNGGTFAWSLAYVSAANFVPLFQYVATLVHNHGLSVAWNPDFQYLTATDVYDSYPGDSYVDYIGPDVYTQAWAETANPTEPTMWNNILTQGDPFVPPGSGTVQQGLDWYVAFAALHGKPLLLPEVGLWPAATSFPGEGGTGDDAYFVQEIGAWAETNHAILILWAQGSVGIFTSGAPNASAQALTSFGIINLGIASPAATASVSVVGTPTQFGIASPAAVASVSAAATLTKLGIASPAAQSSVGVSGAITGIASPAAVTSVSVTGNAIAGAIVSVSATASVSATGTVTQLGAATASAAASVSVAGVLTLLGVASPTSVVSVAVAGVVTKLGIASPAAVASISSSGVVIVNGSVAVTSTASVSATGTVTRFGVTSVTAISSVAVSGILTILGVATAASQASVSATGIDTRFGAASPTSTASITTSGIVTVLGVVTANASVSIFAAAIVISYTGNPGSVGVGFTKATVGVGFSNGSISS